MVPQLQIAEFEHVNGDVAASVLRFRPMDWAVVSTAELGEQAMMSTLPSEALGYRCALVVVDQQGRRRNAVDITFTERFMTTHHSTVMGMDRSGSLHVTLDSAVPVGRADLNLRFKPATVATPADLLPVLDFIEAVKADTKLGLWSHRTSSWAATPVHVSTDFPTLPPGYALTARTLANIQSLTGDSFVMPSEISEEDAGALRQAIMLLSGETLRGTWTQAVLSVDGPTVQILRDICEPYGAMFEFETDYLVNVAGHAIHVGRVAYTLLQIGLSNVASTDDDDAEFTVTLEPGSNAEFGVRLLHPGSSNHQGAGGSATSLDAYAGRWIAQSGLTVVASGDSPRAVLSALERTGKTGSIWRVPGNREESDATVVGL